jgi:hypothetical protein
MVDLETEYEKHIGNLMETLKSPLDDHDFKSVYKSIPNEILELLRETNPEGNLNNSPNLVILSVVNLDESNPCGVCSEALDQLKQWGLDNGAIGDGKVRVLVLPELDDKKLWRKLGISMDEVPRHFIFNKDLALVDVVDGIMSGGYIETFFGEMINAR